MGEDHAENRERFRVGWGDVDGNNHFANRAILDHAADARILYFARNGFAGTEFARENVGPVIVRDELVYRKELRLADEYSVDFELAGISSDGVRFRVRNTFRNSAGEITAVVTSEGVWFDLEARRPRVPPPALDALFRNVPHSTDFEELLTRPPSRERTI